MTTITECEIAPGEGWAGKIGKGHTVRVVSAGAGVSLVCFNAHDLTERFCQARTKVYNMRIWISAGEQLFSKLNNPMMTMVEDGFAVQGRHDLQLSPPLDKGPVGENGGVLEALTTALAPWSLAEAKIPMPLNLFEHTDIDTRSGAITRSPRPPSSPTAVDLRAEMDLVLAVAANRAGENASPHQTVRLSIIAQ